MLYNILFVLYNFLFINMFLHLFCVIFYQYCIWGHGRAMGEYSLTSLNFKSWNNFQMKQNIHNCKTCSVCFVTWNARQRTESPCPNHYCTMVEGWSQTVAIYKIIKPKCHVLLTECNSKIYIRQPIYCDLWESKKIMYLIVSVKTLC